MFGFWKASLVLDGDGVVKDAMGQLTKRPDLPPKKTLAAYIRKAMALNDAGVKMPRRPRAAKAKPLRVPMDLAAALKKNKHSQEAFDAFSQSHRNEYVEWITEARQDETRKRRPQTAITWMGEGKSRNWKYER